MSAIWGIVTIDPSKNLPGDCQTLFETTYQNSCKIDRYESACTEGAYFGCGIQYITKEAESECLPITNKERGILFTADCVLDNREEVIEQLVSRHHDRKVLSEAPDGTLMYLSYLSFGADCAKSFRGLFSIAVWEEHTHTLTLISDQTSSRCLYYMRRDNLIAFSTRTEPLVKLFPDVTPNMDYYKDFLLADPSVIYVVPGETPYKEISLLLPATHLCIKNTGMDASTYWTPEQPHKSNRNSPKKYGAQFLRLYRDCVRDALRTSGEVGIAMSSGLDSSSIGALAASELDANRKHLHSYTFVPYKKPENHTGKNLIYDESVPVLELAKQYPNIKTTFLNNQGKNLFEDMKFCSSLMEMPYKTGTFPNHYEMCCKGASTGCKVFLNGAFGNTTVSFGHIKNILYHLYRKKKFFSFISRLNRYAKHEHISRKKLLSGTIKSFRLFDKRSNDFPKGFIPANVFVTPSILKDYDLKARFKADPRILVANGFLDAKDYPEYLRATSLLMYLGVFETQFGLATGMLLRDPTKDIRIIEFCHNLPYHLFVYQGIPRWLIRSQFQTLLPKSILEPWEQHGVLNVDWVYRVRRDWDTIKPELLHHLSSPILDDCVAKERLIHFIETFDTTTDKNADTLAHLCAVEGLLRFLSSDKEEKR